MKKTIETAVKKGIQLIGIGLLSLGFGCKTVQFNSVAASRDGLSPYNQSEINETVQFNPITPEQEEMISRLVVSRDGLSPYNQSEINEAVQFNPITLKQEEMISKLIVSRDGLHPYSQFEINANEISYQK